MATVMRHVTGGAVIVVALLLVAGCSQGVEPPVTDPTASATPDASASPEPSPSPTVAPTTGVELSIELTSGPATLRAPVEFGEDVVSDPTSALAAEPADIRNFVDLRVRQYSPFGDADLDVFAEARVESPLGGESRERLPDVVVDGVTFYQIAGEDPMFAGWVHEFGVRYDEFDIFISIHSNPEIPQAERDATNAAILASVTLP